MTPSIPKTQLFLARQAPVAMILYRKSHRTTYCLHLDYERRARGFRDRLTAGSRFYGRIFPERCSLSPDGKLFVYFAKRGKRTDGKSDPSTWTAICSPPRLTAHLFFPNGTTWGGGGVFLRDHRLIVFDALPEGAGPEYSKFHGYALLRDRKSLSQDEATLLDKHFKPAAVTHYPRPSGPCRRQKITLVRTAKNRRDGGYDRFDYVLKDAAGHDMEGAEHIVLANWAGWDIYGRLMVAAGRHLHIYDVKPSKPLPKPTKMLDLEAII